MDEMLQRFGQMGQGGFPALEPPVGGGSSRYRPDDEDLYEQSSSGRDLMLRHYGEIYRYQLSITILVPA